MWVRVRLTDRFIAGLVCLDPKSFVMLITFSKSMFLTVHYMYLEELCPNTSVTVREEVRRKG